MSESLFLIKLRASGLNIKKEFLAKVFSCEFFEIFRNPFLQEHIAATASVSDRELNRTQR